MGPFKVIQTIKTHPKTCPITNVIHTSGNLEQIFIHNEQYSALCETHYRLGLKPVDFMKTVFGRQTYCMTTFRRYWVWEFDTHRVYANNQKGIVFEVPLNSKGRKPQLKQALQAWCGFYRTVVRTGRKIEKRHG